MGDQMTKDDILSMAKQAHRDLVTIDYPGHVGQLDAWTICLLERFAALVAEKATEQANARQDASWALMCKKMVAAEREECAMEFDGREGWIPSETAAAAIRARGQK